MALENIMSHLGSRIHPLSRVVLTVSNSGSYLDTVSTVRGSGWVRQRLSTSRKIARRLNLLVETITYVVM